MMENIRTLSSIDPTAVRPEIILKILLGNVPFRDYVPRPPPTATPTERPWPPFLGNFGRAQNMKELKMRTAQQMKPKPLQETSPNFLGKESVVLFSINPPVKPLPWTSLASSGTAQGKMEAANEIKKHQMRPSPVQGISTNFSTQQSVVLFSIDPPERPLPLPSVDRFGTAQAKKGMAKEIKTNQMKPSPVQESSSNLTRQQSIGLLGLDAPGRPPPLPLFDRFGSAQEIAKEINMHQPKPSAVQGFFRQKNIGPFSLDPPKRPLLPSLNGFGEAQVMKDMAKEVTIQQMKPSPVQEFSRDFSRQQSIIGLDAPERTPPIPSLDSFGVAKVKEETDQEIEIQQLQPSPVQKFSTDLSRQQSVLFSIDSPKMAPPMPSLDSFGVAKVKMETDKEVKIQPMKPSPVQEFSNDLSRQQSVLFSIDSPEMAPPLPSLDSFRVAKVKMETDKEVEIQQIKPRPVQFSTNISRQQSGALSSLESPERTPPLLSLGQIKKETYEEIEIQQIRSSPVQEASNAFTRAENTAVPFPSPPETHAPPSLFSFVANPDKEKTGNKVNSQQTQLNPVQKISTNCNGQQDIMVIGVDSPEKSPLPALVSFVAAQSRQMEIEPVHHIKPGPVREFSSNLTGHQNILVYNMGSLGESPVPYLISFGAAQDETGTAKEMNIFQIKPSPVQGISAGFTGDQGIVVYSIDSSEEPLSPSITSFEEDEDECESIGEIDPVQETTSDFTAQHSMDISDEHPDKETDLDQIKGPAMCLGPEEPQELPVSEDMEVSCEPPGCQEAGMTEEPTVCQETEVSPEPAVCQETEVSPNPAVCQEASECQNPETSHEETAKGPEQGEGLKSSECSDKPEEETDSGNKLYICASCGETFEVWKYLVRHFIVHGGMKPYQCPECGKCFAYPSKLITHRKTHERQKSHLCMECGRCFIHESNLIVHQKIHSGDKPHVCSECGKSFLYRSKLLAHQKTHSENKSHPCTDCDKTFDKKCKLAVHQEVHNGLKPFQCTLCKKGFPRKCSLIIHMRRHTGERPYACHLCTRSFVELAKLRRHIRVHTGEKPYKCPFCGKPFNDSSSMNRHKRMHHGKPNAGDPAKPRPDGKPLQGVRRSIKTEQVEREVSKLPQDHNGEWPTLEGTDLQIKSEQVESLVTESRVEPTDTHRLAEDIISKPSKIIRKPSKITRKPPEIIHKPPEIIHKPPEIIHKPPEIIHNPPEIIHKPLEIPPVIIHKPPEMTHKPPVIIHTPPKIILKPREIIHTPPKTIRKPPIIIRKPPIIIRKPQGIIHKPPIIIHRPPEIIHTPPEIIHKPQEIIHTPPDMEPTEVFRWSVDNQKVTAEPHFVVGGADSTLHPQTQIEPVLKWTVSNQEVTTQEEPRLHHPASASPPLLAEPVLKWSVSNQQVEEESLLDYVRDEEQSKPAEKWNVNRLALNEQDVAHMHKGVQREYKLRCEDCGQAFLTLSWYIKHRRLHRLEKQQGLLPGEPPAAQVLMTETQSESFICRDIVLQNLGLISGDALSRASATFPHIPSIVEGNMAAGGEIQVVQLE